ncbi:hypothetical protein [Alteromonas oceanisediminis]|uniref:hypothetical protein n=1 Tax=Alteromonas oceanisediminis TaxID=2836180 RepID=UPI001BD95213|nr:hypothetical protein [Alteromonas oceanisediminis]MBT0585276.1 hypothetical protein [Alteromonas oceanisediminis]
MMQKADWQSLQKVLAVTKSFYAKKAIMKYLDEMEDTSIAIDRVERPGKRISMADVGD